MNSKAIYAAGGGIVVVAVAIFFFMGSGIIDNNSTNIANNENVTQVARTLELSVRNVSVNQVDNKTADVMVAFDVFNPSPSTIILEAIQYNVFVDKNRMASGDIGAKPEGFVASQEGIFPVIGNGTITVKDTKASERNNLIAASWDKMVSGNTSFVLNGIYSYRQTSSLQAIEGDKEFELTFP